MVKGIRQLAGDDVDPLRVTFGHPAPRRLHAHRGFSLSQPDASVTRVALDLGFADSSALTHACQRWFSRPPGELKRKPH